MDTETRPTIPPGPYRPYVEKGRQSFRLMIGGLMYRVELEDVKGYLPSGRLWDATQEKVDQIITTLWNQGRVSPVHPERESLQSPHVGDFMLEAAHALSPVVDIVLDAVAPGEEQWFTLSAKVRKLGRRTEVTALSLIPEENSNIRGSCPWSPPSS